MNIAVVGAGAFGTALAIALAQRQNVTLWARDATHVAEMMSERENKRRLPGVPFPTNVTVSADLEPVFGSDIILLAVPMQALVEFVNQHDLSANAVVACCKGIDLNSGRSPSAILEGAAQVAVLTGPSFAQDIARGLPTALTLACADRDAAAVLQTALSTPVLRLYRTTDVIGAELGGALKNVIAIGCGAVKGAGLGDSARAALMTRGFAEMQRIGTVMKAEADTLMGLSGLGDLTLTCTSEQSRNYRLGFALGAGAEFDASTTVEGAATARALRKLATELHVDLPVCMAVADLVDNKVNIKGAIDRLLARPLKEE